MFHDSGSRFTHVLSFIQRLAGGAKPGYMNPVFLAQKQKFLKQKAISHFMKVLICDAIGAPGS